MGPNSPCTLEVKLPPEINSLTRRLNPSRSVGSHLKPNDFSHLYQWRRATLFYFEENLNVTSFWSMLMSDEVTNFFRAVPHKENPNYQAAFLSVLLIALLIAYMIAVLHRVGAVTPYEVAIPF
jgi:hypothetical protein